MRSFDANLVSQAVATFEYPEEGFDPVDWVGQDTNVVLTNTDGDIALFRHEKVGVVNGHYCFKSRGKKAVTVGKNFLAEIFDPCYNIQVVMGLTPIENLGARWMSRQLGFTSHGVVNTTIGPHELFILHRTSYDGIHAPEGPHQ